ncbi:PLP-dependent aminotransferase family protein [Caballeronia sp. 15715]|uniref:aminotransferase-like domain-containing protein n=1 Tax=Caballeronia sp. 15715 TaxID=3391030 RepID=UPI0039E47BD5
MERFRQVAELVQTRIDSGLIRPGDKLPSLRRLAGETGFSVVTVYKAYELLETQGVCSSRDRSGFYALTGPQKTVPRRSHSLSVMPPDDVRSLADAFASRAQFHGTAPDMMLPAFGNVADTTLARGFRRALLHTYPHGNGSNREDEALRVAIAKRAAQRGIQASQDQVVVTRSAIEGFNLCLDSFTEGDRPVLVESPSSYSVLESLRHRRIKAIEIYSHPEFGVDPSQFEHILETTGVRLCVMAGTNRVPTGKTYDRDTLKRLVEAAERHGAVIIENGVTGDLGYSSLGSPTLAGIDRNDTVVQFGGTTSYLSSDFEIGWVVGAEKHAAKLLATRQLSGVNMPHRALQMALAQYLNSRLAERQLRHIRQTLEERMHEGIDLVRTGFPAQTLVSVPTGGFMCWVRGPRHLDSMRLAMTAELDTFDFMPGPYFSPAGAFRNFVALNFSAEWTSGQKARLRALGERMRARHDVKD